MKLADLQEGHHVEVHWAGIGWVRGYVTKVTPNRAHVALPGHPLWSKHWQGVTLSRHDFTFGLVRDCASRCTGCDFPAHATESNDDGLCVACMREAGIAPLYPTDTLPVRSTPARRRTGQEGGD